jgi:hypothetical protein
VFEFSPVASRPESVNLIKSVFLLLCGKTRSEEEKNLSFSSSLIVLLTCVSGFLPPAVLRDFLLNLILINMPSRNRRSARPDGRRGPGLPNHQCRYGLVPGPINPQDLGLPPRRRYPPAGLLITSLQFSESAEVKRLQKVAGVRGKPDYLNIVARVQIQEFLFVVRRTVVHDEKEKLHRIVCDVPKVHTTWSQNFADGEGHGVAILVPSPGLVKSKTV